MTLKGNDNSHLKAGYVPLKEYADARFEAIARAVDKAESTLAARLAGMNEFRDQLKDQASRFVTREEVQLTVKPIVEDIRCIRDFINKQEGKASQRSVLFAAALGLSGLILGLLRLFL